MPDVHLTVNGVDYGGWKSMRLARGIEQIAGTFELGVSELWPGQKIVREITMGDACSVKIDGTTVITGYVDEVAPGYGKDAHEVSVVGRDATGDLVDCSALFKTGQWSGAKADAIIRDLCQPFGIKVKTDVDGASAAVDVTQLSLQGGEAVFEILDRIAKLKAVLLMSDGQGGLVITKAGRGGRVATALQRGVNILGGRLNFSFKERFSRYIVKGQGASSDALFGDATRLKAETTDPMVKRYRPLVVIADDLADGATVKRRALWEANTRAGKSAQFGITVQGWRHPEGLWQPNTLVRLTDPWLRTDAELLVKSVQFSLDDSGSFTTLALTSPQAFELIPMPKKPADAWDMLGKQQQEIDRLKREQERAKK